MRVPPAHPSHCSLTSVIFSSRSRIPSVGVLVAVPLVVGHKGQAFIGRVPRCFMELKQGLA